MFSAEEAQRFIKHLLQIHNDNITSRSVIVKKSTQPWFAERGEEAVMRKHTAQGTEQKVELAREWSELLMEEHYKYFADIRVKLVEAKLS